jgi:hypothetical protein
MSKLQTSDVFTPGKNTTYTYVERKHDNDAAAKLRTYIRSGGHLVSMVGPTKMGKTVLAQREAPQAFTIQGHAIREVDDFWVRLASWLDIPTENSHTKVTGDKSKWGFRSRLGFFGAAEVGADAGGEHSKQTGTTSSTSINADQAALDAVKTIRAGDGKITIIIDDFHFIPRVVRKALVQALKPLAYEGATIILITLPHRRAETTDLVSDMGGRTKTVEVKPWEPADLAAIAALGLPHLHLEDPLLLGPKLAAASYGSPQIMQQLCLELVETVNGFLEERDEPTPLNEPSDWPSFYRELSDEHAIKWVQRFIGGPPVRGQKRRKHLLTDGREFDGYQVIIAALKELGPPLGLTTPELSTQIDRMLKDSKAVDVTVGNKLAQMSVLASRPLMAKLKEAETEDAAPASLFEGIDEDPASGAPQPVFEYVPDAVGETIHIHEPYVAYTIRWHLDNLL